MPLHRIRLPRSISIARRLTIQPPTTVPRSLGAPLSRRSITYGCRVHTHRVSQAASSAVVQPSQDVSSAFDPSSSTSTSRTKPSFDRNPHPSAVLTSDDQILKAHFDEPWSSTSSGSSSTTLFGFPPLSSPNSLVSLTERTLIQARAIVDRLGRAPLDPTGKELRLVVKNLDRLSDTLCGVIDMCELVRNVHPDPSWVERADEAYERLCSYMNELNTSQGLYQSLVATLRHPHTTPLSEAETQVALSFLRDFEKSGIHLPKDVRERFVEISDNLLSIGRTFLSNASAGPPSTPRIEIPDADRLLAGLGSRFLDSLPRGRMSKRDSRYVTPGSWESQMIARFAREGEARRLVYIGNLAHDAERVAVLETMLKQRSELADVLGKETWAEVALVDKMAKTPENVMGFLKSLAEHHRPAAVADVATLNRLKSLSMTGNEPPENAETSVLTPFYAWDRDYFSEKHALSLNSSSLPPITPYLSVGTVLLGLSRLFTRLYGISFKPAPVQPGEVWHPDVRRLDVMDETEGLIGVIYCDLFSREGKPPSAAHYTVRTSRRVDDDDMIGDGLAEGWDQAFGPGLEVEGEAQFGREGKYQLPIVVLTTDFGTVEPGKPALLSWTDMETLFHEMGHAIHSMIGRTEYHNVSGTRCATDFVELPSILMEHFVSSPAVLSLFASHYVTGEPLPLPLLEAHLEIQSSLSALETHSQILMAILDQEYHTLRVSDLASFDSSEVYHRLQDTIGVIPSVEGTAWQTQFGHLHGYGATYYSYLFDRAIAGKVWKTLFNHTPEGSLRREAGELFKQKVLKWGGGKDPWEMVGSVVGGHEGEMVAKGDEKAMEIVGGWTIK